MHSVATFGIEATECVPKLKILAFCDQIVRHICLVTTVDEFCERAHATVAVCIRRHRLSSGSVLGKECT